MNRGRRKLQICAMLTGILFCCVGCGLQQEMQNLEASQVATGGALCIAADYHSKEVQQQLDILVKNAHKWRISGDEVRIEDEIVYAVTDLDRNGRIEIMAFREQWDEERVVLQHFFEVNASGNGVKEIETDQMGEISLEEMQGNLDSAYYDPKTGECYYVIGNKLSEEEMLSDESEEYDKNIMALTLQQGQLSCDILACQEQSKNQAGKMQSRFYQMEGTGKNEMDPSCYTVEALGDASYTNCEKYSLRISTFFFDHSLEDMTEKQMHHALEKSYRESFMGYPLEQQEKKVAGQKIHIPQYNTMQDAGKQKRINQVIVKQTEQILNQLDSLQDRKGNWNVDVSIKYAGKDRVSLLVQAGKSPQKDKEFSGDVTQENRICDTINIDLEQGSILSERDFLTESDRQYLLEEVQEEMEEEMEESEEAGDKRKSDDFYKNLMEHLKKWQDISLYQTGDMIGFVIPTGLASDPYVTREVWYEWDAPDDAYGGVFFTKIDWEAYQYRMFASEYQDLQDYMPLLTGGAEFTCQRADWEWGEDDEERKNMTLSSWSEELFSESLAELYVNSVCICDVTQDGKAELILDISNGMQLILHKEGNAYYGTFKGSRELCGLQKNGVYHAGRYTVFLYQMRFEKDHFVEDYLGQYVYYNMSEDSTKEEYYIQERKVKKSVYEKWEKSMMDGDVYWYSPEALDNK